MGLTRKTVLKRLETINLAKWGDLKKIDERVDFSERYVKASKKADSGDNIRSAMSLLIFELWGIPSTKISRQTIMKNARAAAKEYIQIPKDMQFEYSWLGDLWSLMLIASLQDDDADLVQFSNCFKIEPQRGPMSFREGTLKPILYGVANMFRDEKFDNVEELTKSMRHYKVPRLLNSALDGIRKRDAKKAFADLIAAALDHAKRTNAVRFKYSNPSESDIVDKGSSLLWNVAELQGLHPPAIPPEIRPFMVIRQTLGLPPVSTVND